MTIRKFLEDRTMDNKLPHTAFIKPTGTPAFTKTDRERLKRNGCPPRHLAHYAAQINAQAKTFDRDNAVHQYMGWFRDNHPARELPEWAKPVDDVATYFKVETDTEGLRLLTDTAPAKCAPKGPNAAQWRKLVARILACDEKAIREAQDLLAA